MHNLGVVISFEFMRTIKKKSFWLSILAFPVIMSIVFALSYFSNKSADSATEQTNKEKFSIIILDNSKLISSDLVDSIGAKRVLTKEEGITQVKQNQVDAFFWYPSEPSKQPLELYAKDIGLTKNGKYETVAQQLLKTSISKDIGSTEKVTILQGQVPVIVQTFSEGKPVKGLGRVIAPGAFLVLFYLVIALLGNQMLASTTEEKENRVIEMILTSVTARTLIIGKIMALILLGIVQVGVTAGFPLLIGKLFGSSLNIPVINWSDIQIDPLQMIIGAVIFIASFFLFTGMLVAIGAVMPTAKEANNFFGLVLFGMFVPFYAFMAIVSTPDQLIVKFFSFFPLTAPITLLLRNAVGNLTRAEAIIGIVILIVSSGIALAVAVRAFSSGTLEYNRKLSLKELFSR